MIWEVRQWFNEEYDKLTLNDLHQFNSEEESKTFVQELCDELKEYSSGNIHRYGSAVQSYVDKILIQKGYPTKPLVKGSPRQLRSAARQAHVDKSGKEYQQFCEFIRKGLVNLTEKSSC